jgi:serine/threonine-protein kinase
MPSKEPEIKARRISCPSCRKSSYVRSKQPPSFCPYCGFNLGSFSSTEDMPRETSEAEESAISFVPGLEPKDESVQFTIGSYKIFKSIGKGGMGEVLLAYDTVCGRRIALKRIRPDLLSFRQIKNRFLKEARVTAQLTHPAIIPIYTIQQEEKFAYYTMPFVEGETLKQILRKSSTLEKKGEKVDQAGGSIPALMRIFLSICQAVAYAHSKSILHRDLKPENMIVGQYGEVMILDWGLAKQWTEGKDEENSEEEEAPPNPLHHMTQMGKVVGTVGYMAPERALGQEADKKTDIYSLGVILYQILTLHMPFKRGTLKEFRKKMAEEQLHDPIEAAPYRDIPKVLSQMALKCLSPNPADRYETVDELIRDIENYLEGKAEWFEIAELDVARKKDWEFQENILIAEHTAITRTAEISEWVNLMISKAPFAENIRIETRVFLQSQCQGIGILFNVPERGERENINDGYCLWLASAQSKTTKLMRSSVEVFSWPDVILKPNQWHSIRVEKVDNTIRLWINNEEEFSYISRMPLTGTHMGILARDTHFSIEPLHIFISSQNVMVNCLAIPDAFLAKKDYQHALSEYRRIGYSFAGRAEGREAVLRAGITLIEQAKSSSSTEESTQLYDAALEEFEKLHRTAGAPLQYLGKALVYSAQKDIEEEVKCFELAYRRYPHHPLLHALEEQMLFRLMESSRTDRKAAYHFLLLTLSHLKKVPPSLANLITYLKKHWEPIEFLLPSAQDEKYDMIIPLSFWLHKNYAFEESIHALEIQDASPNRTLVNAFLCLIALNEQGLAEKMINQLPKSRFKKEKQLLLPLLNQDFKGALHLLTDPPFPEYKSALGILCDQAIDQKQTRFIHQLYERLPPRQRKQIVSKKIWAALLDRNFDEAGVLFEKIPLEFLTQDSSILHFLYGCWLSVAETKDIAEIHWGATLEVPFPPTWSLAAHYLTGKLDPSWFKKAFDWERWQLQRQLMLVKSLS